MHWVDPDSGEIVNKPIERAMFLIRFCRSGTYTPTAVEVRLHTMASRDFSGLDLASRPPLLVPRHLALLVDSISACDAGTLGNIETLFESPRQ
jgi:hypothetical protein